MKKILTMLLALTMMVSLFTGCGAANKPDTTNTPDNGSEKMADGDKDKDMTSENKGDDKMEPSGDKVEITWWAFPTFSQEKGDDPAGTWEKKVIAAFEAKNPNISVKLETIDFTSGPEKITTAIQAGTMADVLFDAPGRIITYGKNGQLAELNDMFTEELIQDINNDTLLSSTRAGDKYYMYPLSSAPFYMVVNKQMAEEAGVADLIKEGWTTEDFVTVITALKEKGYEPGSFFSNGQGGDQGPRAFFANLYNGSITDAQVTKYVTDNEAGVKAMTLIKKMIDDRVMANGSAYNGGEDIQNFANGITSFTILWSPAMPKIHAALLEASGVEYIEVPYPSESGSGSLEYLVNGFCVFNNGDDKKIEAAKEFVRFLCDDEEFGPMNVVRSGSFPVRQSFGDLYGDERMAMLSKWSKYYAPYYNTIDGFAEMRQIWFPMVQAVSNGEKEPEAALKEFTEKANATIK